MKPQRFGSNLLGVLYNNFSKKDARNLGANSRNPGANSRNPGAILKSGGLLFYIFYVDTDDQRKGLLAAAS